MIQPFSSIATTVRRSLHNIACKPVVIQAGSASSKPAQALISLLSAGLVLSSAAVMPEPALAKEKVGEFAASGLVFKDTVQVEAISDPDIEGITLYISDFKRSLSDRLSKDFFTDPSQTSITAVVTGPLRIKDIRSLGGSEGREIFAEGKGINIFKNKTVRVRRIYDEERSCVVYVTYSTRLTGASDDGGASAGRYRTSVTAIALPPSAFPAPAGAAAQ